MGSTSRIYERHEHSAVSHKFRVAHSFYVIANLSCKELSEIQVVIYVGHFGSAGVVQEPGAGCVSGCNMRLVEEKQMAEASSRWRVTCQVATECAVVPVTNGKPSASCGVSWCQRCRRRKVCGNGVAISQCAENSLLQRLLRSSKRGICSEAKRACAHTTRVKALAMHNAAPCGMPRCGADAHVDELWNESLAGVSRRCVAGIEFASTRIHGRHHQAHCHQ